MKLEEILTDVSNKGELFADKLNSYIEEDEVSVTEQTILTQEKVLLDGMKGLNRLKIILKKVFRAVKVEVEFL